MGSITNFPIWQKLKEQSQKLSGTRIIDLFTNDTKRASIFSIEACGLLFDYSKHLIDSETISMLARLADSCNLASKREEMFNGGIINTTEQRAVLHTAIRNFDEKSILVKNQNIMPEIHTSLKLILECATKIRNGKWVGGTGKTVTDVVNIGIGGSHLGPCMVVEALKPYQTNKINCHFVSNIDGTDISETLKKLDPETTLFLLCSKTFTTQETLVNTKTAQAWLANKINAKEIFRKHFIVITASPNKAIEFGISEKNVFPFWDWLGGRFSLWGAIGLSIAIAIGDNHFKEFLAGAYAMDKHFRETPWESNMPAIMALLGIWNINFLGTKSLAILPYDQYLVALPSYLQQLEMESNGKSVKYDGTMVDYDTAPVIWGGVGTNGQHAFHQLLMQGTQKIPVDFIVPLKSHNPVNDHHLLLFANCLAQSQALMEGKSINDVKKELAAAGLNEQEIAKIALHKVIPGNIPSSTILTEKITPYTLGTLIALYEHKVFVQGIIWEINSFDQWGVELGKKLAQNITLRLQEKSDLAGLDSSTCELIKHYFLGYL